MAKTDSYAEFFREGTKEGVPADVGGESTAVLLVGRDDLPEGAVGHQEPCMICRKLVWLPDDDQRIRDLRTAALNLFVVCVSCATATQETLADKVKVHEKYRMGPNPENN